MTARDRSRAAQLGHMTRRLVALHAETTAADLAAGLAWYDRARAAAEGMAVDDDVEMAAGTIAALSPRETWSRNVANAAAMLEWAADDTRGLDTMPRVSTHTMRRQAWRIVGGEHPLDVLHGPKVRAFFRNIMGDTDAVCVDTWAARAATGDRSVTNVSRARYALIERAYQRAAHIVGMAPRDLQAAVWIHVRGAAD